MLFRKLTSVLREIGKFDTQKVTKRKKGKIAICDRDPKLCAQIKLTIIYRSQFSCEIGTAFLDI